MALPTTEDGYFDLAFEPHEAALALKSLSLLLAGTIREFTVESSQNGPIKYGRLEMRTFAGEPIYYFRLLWSGRGMFLPPEFVREQLASMQAQLGDDAEVLAH